MMYVNGTGVPEDYVRAHMWFNLAASRSTGEDRKRRVEGPPVPIICETTSLLSLV